MSVVSFAHIGLSCKNLDETEKFYVENFDYKRARVVPLGETKIVFLKNPGGYLELFQAQGESPDPTPKKDGPAYPGFRHMAFEVENVEAFLKKMGDKAKISLGPLAFDDFIKGWAAVWIQDPDGRILEISQGYKDE